MKNLVSFYGYIDEFRLKLEDYRPDSDWKKEVISGRVKHVGIWTNLWINLKCLEIPLFGIADYGRLTRDIYKGRRLPQIESLSILIYLDKYVSEEDYHNLVTDIGEFSAWAICRQLYSVRITTDHVLFSTSPKVGNDKKTEQAFLKTYRCYLEAVRQELESEETCNLKPDGYIRFSEQSFYASILWRLHWVGSHEKEEYRAEFASIFEALCGIKQRLRSRNMNSSVEKTCVSAAQLILDLPQCPVSANKKMRKFYDFLMENTMNDSTGCYVLK